MYRDSQILIHTLSHPSFSRRRESILQSKVTMLSGQDYLDFRVESSDYRLPYGTHPAQFIDLFLPTTPPKTTILLIHGGCWQAEFDLVPLGQLARALTKHGYAVASVEYRRLGNGGGWPNTFLDVGAAADFLGGISAEYDLPLDRLITMGHSAGGHLALWLACRAQLTATQPLYTPNPQPIHAVVSLAGIPDMAAAVTREICQDSPQNLLDGLPNEKPDHYAVGSPVNFLPLGVPHVHINGKDDPIVPIDYVREFVEKAGDEARLIAVEGGHFEVVSADFFDPSWIP